MNIFGSIWHSAGSALFAILIAAHLVAPTPANQEIIPQKTSVQIIIPSAATSVKNTPAIPLSGNKKTTTISTPPALVKITQQKVAPKIEIQLPPQSMQPTGVTTHSPDTTAPTPQATTPVGSTPNSPSTYSSAALGSPTAGNTTNYTPSTLQAPQPSGILCNGTYWNQCPSGQNFSCSSNGGTCSLPAVTTYIAPQQSVPIISTPLVPAGPTAEQQSATCQRQYDTALSSLDIGETQTEDFLNNSIAAEQQTINQLANSGVAFSGTMGQAQQNLANTQARLASTINQYQTSLGVLKNTLQICLSSISQS